MRESIGGAFLIKIMVIFLVIYNSLLAIAVNYAIAFRVKNQIINIVTENEGCQNIAFKDRNMIKNYVKSVGYYRATSYDEKGYDIHAINTDRGTYYQIVTYVVFDFPIVRDLFRFGISGETKVIFGKSETQDKCNNI